jgi:bifunctional DNA-binding transcriptional regulator/antitoxin component of YhaV-PrlF toxin-antitoxin module
MTTLTITSKGQVTFKREILKHLDAAPGDRLDVNLLPGGRLEVKAVPTGGIEGFVGLLANKTRKRASIEQIDAAAAAGWADVKP